MEIKEAILNRRSVRKFKPEPVPKHILEELMELCLWTPSGGNKQPWEFVILGGGKMKEVADRLWKMAEEDHGQSFGEFKHANPDIPYPPMGEPYLHRMQESREHLNAARLRDDQGDPLHLNGVRFFDAPNAIIVLTDKSLGIRGVLEIGMVIQTITLAAMDFGLGTCIESVVTYWPQILRECLNIPESKLIAIGIAIGYPDKQAPVNMIKRTREPLNVFAKWYNGQR